VPASAVAVAYLVNQYPKVSHTFVRREIQALEQEGVSVTRFALRGWDADVTDEADLQERARTQYVLEGGAPADVGRDRGDHRAARPFAFARAFASSLRMSRRSLRPCHTTSSTSPRRRGCAWQPARRRVSTTCTPISGNQRGLRSRCSSHELGGRPTASQCTDRRSSMRPNRCICGPKIDTGRRSSSRSDRSDAASLYRWIAADQCPRCAVVHCGLDAQFDFVARERERHCDALVCVGRLCEQKGQLLLLDAVAIVVARGRALELVLAGDGEMRETIERKIDALGLRDRVRITGWINGEQVRAEILASRALVLPSFAEGLPVVIMEAMALRRPVLATFIAGNAELVRPGVDGWLVPAGDVQALADAIETCLETPLPILARMGEDAHDRVVSRHTIAVEARKLVDLFPRAAPCALPRSVMIASIVGGSCSPRRRCCSCPSRCSRAGPCRAPGRPCRQAIDAGRATPDDGHPDAGARRGRGHRRGDRYGPVATAQRRQAPRRRRQLQRSDRRHRRGTRRTRSSSATTPIGAARAIALDHGVRHLAAAPPCGGDRRRRRLRGRTR
jgi:glycosyltransferase involved in cell wall biosynthesis